jgi:hypothetical protein
VFSANSVYSCRCSYLILGNAVKYEIYAIELE